MYRSPQVRAQALSLRVMCVLCVYMCVRLSLVVTLTAYLLFIDAYSGFGRADPKSLEANREVGAHTQRLMHVIHSVAEQLVPYPEALPCFLCVFVNVCVSVFMSVNVFVCYCGCMWLRHHRTIAFSCLAPVRT